MTRHPKPIEVAITPEQVRLVVDAEKKKAGLERRIVALQVAIEEVQQEQGQLLTGIIAGHGYSKQMAVVGLDPEKNTLTIVDA